MNSPTDEPISIDVATPATAAGERLRPVGPADPSGGADPTGGPDAVGTPESAAAPDGAAPSGPEPDDDAVVAAALARIEDKLSEGQRLGERQAEISGKLHAENQKLRAGELRQAQAALVLSVLRVFDDVSQMASTTEDPAARSDLGIVADALADALARNGVEPVIVDVGEAFTASRHKIVSIEQTADAEGDRTVARVVRPGFAWSDGQVVRVSHVAVFKHAPTPLPSTGSDDDRQPPAADPTDGATAQTAATDATPEASTSIER